MSTEASDIVINVKGSERPSDERTAIDALVGPSELKLQVTISNSKTVRELKDEIAKSTDVEADRQRLIYSGEPGL